MKLGFFKVSSFSCNQIFLVLEPTTCEVGWKPWRSSCYGFVTLTRTWNAAQDDCQRRYGDLLIINDEDEQDFITDEVANSNTV